MSIYKRNFYKSRCMYFSIKHEKFSEKYNKIWGKKFKINSEHCVKSIHIWSYSGLHFLVFRLNTERYSAFLRIQSECGKMQTRITANADTSHAVNPAHNKKYLKVEKKSTQQKAFNLILIDSVYRKDENYHPKVLLEKFDSNDSHNVDSDEEYFDDSDDS